MYNDSLKSFDSEIPDSADGIDAGKEKYDEAKKHLLNFLRRPDNALFRERAGKDVAVQKGSDLSLEIQYFDRADMLVRKLGENPENQEAIHEFVDFALGMDPNATEPSFDIKQAQERAQKVIEFMNRDFEDAFEIEVLKEGRREHVNYYEKLIKLIEYSSEVCRLKTGIFSTDIDTDPTETDKRKLVKNRKKLLRELKGFCESLNELDLEGLDFIRCRICRKDIGKNKIATVYKIENPENTEIAYIGEYIARYLGVFSPGLMGMLVYKKALGYIKDLDRKDAKIKEIEDHMSALNDDVSQRAEFNELNEQLEHISVEIDNLLRLLNEELRNINYNIIPKCRLSKIDIIIPKAITDWGERGDDDSSSDASDESESD